MSIKKISTIAAFFFTLGLIVLSGLMARIHKIYAYSCPTGYYCNNNGGTFPIGWYFQYQDSTRHCSYWRPSYSCSGDSSSCTQSPSTTDRTIYPSEADCKANINGSNTHWACCDKETCSHTCPSCTPATCGSEYTETNTGCPATTKTCTSTTGCGETCTGGSRTCYPLEQNVAPSAPSSVTITVDGKSYALSTNSSNPTIIHIPTTTNVTLTTPVLAPPSTSNGVGYNFSVNNYGVSNEWSSFSCTNSEDFCYTGTSNTINFTPYSKSMNLVLKEGASGQIAVKYYTVDKCDTNKVYSTTALTGYYKVDSVPTCPNCNNTLPNIVLDQTDEGCSSSEYTGTKINNPLRFEMTITDANSVGEIQGAIIWLSKDNSVPSPTTTINAGTGPQIDVANDIGIFIRKNGTWPNTYLYGYDAGSNQWKQVQTAVNGKLSNMEGQISLQVLNVAISTSTTSVTVKFDLMALFDGVDTKPIGKYNIYALGLDSYMINGTTVDQSRMVLYNTWGFDLVNPTVSSFSQSIYSATLTDLSWKVSDTESGIDQTLLTPYRVGGSAKATKLFTTPPKYLNQKNPEIVPPDMPKNDTITVKHDDNVLSWLFLSTTEETDRLDIGENESGSINVYVTTYDKACNYDAEELIIDLNPWFTTRGGTVYSKGSVFTSPKDISSISSLTNLINKDTTNGNADLATELLASRNSVISILIHSASSKAVTASQIYDSNSLKSYWFENLTNKSLSRASQFTKFQSLSTKTSIDCPTGDNCYIYSAEDISIPNGYVCDKNTLIISDHDIFIDPDITSDNTKLSGCIFLAKNNIHIGDGKYKSKEYSSPQYDYLDGFLIADNQIIFDLTDTGESIRDGVEIYGGLIALGSNISSPEKAIQMNRNLRLYSQTNPTVVQLYNNKFAAISQIFFGSEAPIYKQEVGFKAF